MLGISVYLPGSDPSLSLPFQTIFTSLHIPEDHPDMYRKELDKLGRLAQKYQVELMADISPTSLTHLGFTLDEAHRVKGWGVTGLRIDYGVEPEVIASLSRRMKIAVNASTVTQEELTTLAKNRANFTSMEAWHNYYPRPETALGWEEFTAKNQLLKEAGFKVAAFIPGDGKRRGPVCQGLPTLEAHRNYSSFAAFMELNQDPYVDHIVIGDPSVNEGSKKQFAAYYNGVILLRAKCFTENVSIQQLLQKKQTNRLDAARDVIRSAESRQPDFGHTFPIRAEHTMERTIGAITIDNENYGRYQGEVQITKRTLPADDKVNVIGRVIPEDRPLLPYIKGGMMFQVEWVRCQ